MNIEGQPDHGELIQNVPPPQTVRGTFSEVGLPMLYKPLPLDTFDIQNILSRKHLITMLTIDKNTITTTLQITPSRMLRSNLATIILSSARRYIAKPKLTLWMNKPIGVTGKIMVQIGINGSAFINTSKQNSLHYLWDLSATDNLEIELPFLTPLVGKPTTHADISTTGFQSPNAIYEYMPIDIILRPKNPIQPGSIYPDTYYVYSFISWDNVTLMEPRSMYLQSEEKLI